MGVREEVIEMVRPNRHSVPALISAFLLSLFTIIPAAANNTAQSLPSPRTGRTSVRSRSATTGQAWMASRLPRRGHQHGRGPIRPLAVLHTGDLDVFADQTNTAITNGGVAEFELADPVVALQGSGTADAPYLLFHLDTTGCSRHHRLVQPPRHRRDRQRGPTGRTPLPSRFQRQLHERSDGYVADATAGPGLEHRSRR